MNHLNLVQISQQLSQQLKNLLDNFDKNEKSADYLCWLLKVEQTLKENCSTFIIDKFLLNKRLIQCLNTQVSPDIPEQTIKIFELLFNTFKQVSQQSYDDYCQIFYQEMALYSSGIFPFYKQSTPQMKIIILQITRNYYVPLKRQIIPCLPGILHGLLPGLNDNMNFLIDDLYKTFDLLKQASGRKYFIGCLWMVLKRQQSGRAGGIKLLSSLIPKLSGENQLQNLNVIDFIEQENGIEDELHEHSKSLMLKMMESVFETENNNNKFFQDFQWIEKQDYSGFLTQVDSQVQEKTDYLEQNINENCDENNYPNKSTLITNFIVTCLQDPSIEVRKNIFDFLITHIQLKSSFFSFQDKTNINFYFGLQRVYEGNIIIIINLQYFQVYAALQLYLFNDKNILIKFHAWLFGNNSKNQINQDQELIQIIANSFNNLFAQIPSNSINAMNPIIILQKFYNFHEQLMPEIINYISPNLIQYIFTLKQRNQLSSDLKDLVIKFLVQSKQNINNFIDGLNNQLIKEGQNKFNIIQKINFFINSLLNQLKDVENQILIQFLSGIFICLGKQQFQEINSQDFIKPALILSLNLIKKLESIENQKENENESEPKQLVMVKKILYNDILNDSSLQELTIFFQNIVLQLKQNLNDSKLIILFKLTSDLIIKSQKYLPIQQMNELPLWFKCITQCIIINSQTLSFYAIQSMIQIFLFEEKYEIYSILKDLIIKENQYKYTLQNELVLGEEYIKKTLEKLWGILDYEHQNEQIIELIINYTKYFPQQFKEVLSDSFGNQQGQKLISQNNKIKISIQRFALFWKLTQQYQSEKQYLAELNKVGLSYMLSFIDDSNPIIRHITKNWLIECIPYLNNILDPILEELITYNCKNFVTFQKQIIYIEEYDTNKILENFRKLRSVLMIVSKVFVNYVTNNNLSKSLESLKVQFISIDYSILFNDETQSEQMQQDTFMKIKKRKMTYIDIIIILCIKFMEGKALESISRNFYQQNQAVIAISCEFLELLIQHVEDAQVSQLLCKNILEPLMQQFWYYVENNESILQIKILNIMKVIFFHSHFSQKKLQHQKKDIFVSALTSKQFIPGILMALKENNSYHRYDPHDFQ